MPSSPRIVVERFMGVVFTCNSSYTRVDNSWLTDFSAG